MPRQNRNYVYLKVSSDMKVKSDVWVIFSAAGPEEMWGCFYLHICENGWAVHTKSVDPIPPSALSCSHPAGNTSRLAQHKVLAVFIVLVYMAQTQGHLCTLLGCHSDLWTSGSWLNQLMNQTTIPRCCCCCCCCCYFKLCCHAVVPWGKRPWSSCDLCESEERTDS